MRAAVYVKCVRALRASIFLRLGVFSCAVIECEETLRWWCRRTAKRGAVEQVSGRKTVSEQQAGQAATEGFMWR
jgi:hypothetical protein